MWKETFVKRLSLQLLESFIGAVTQEHYLHNNYLYNSSRINWNGYNRTFKSYNNSENTDVMIISIKMQKNVQVQEMIFSSLYSVGTRMLFVCRLQNGWRNDKPKGVWSIPDLSFLSLKKCISKLLFTRWGHLWIMLGKDSETLKVAHPPPTNALWR